MLVLLPVAELLLLLLLLLLLAKLLLLEATSFPNTSFMLNENFFRTVPPSLQLACLASLLLCDAKDSSADVIDVPVG